jgi:hypothetical protein
MTNAAKKAAAARPSQENTPEPLPLGAAEQAGATEQSSTEAAADIAVQVAADQAAENTDIIDDVVHEQAVPRATRARVLVQCKLGEPNDVIEVDADQVAQLGDVIDIDASAVAYALSLRA